ncbi:MAG: ATP-dependent DNA helicase RecG [Synergistaceae bacterium]|nr:ATP-dependent DNA helicase RecG [Synergistaceae bacterium]
MTSPVRRLSDPVRYVKGVGPAREVLLGRLGIACVNDLLFFFPRRYEDRRELTPLSSLTGGSMSSVVAKVVAIERRKSLKKGLSITTVLLSDGQGMAKAVWFNRPGLESQFLPGVRAALYGRVDVRSGRVQLTNPDFEILNDETEDEKAFSIVPIYPGTAGLTNKTFRRIIKMCLEEYLPLLSDFLPSEMKSRLALAPLALSVAEMHFPESKERWRAARKRLAFDEFFLLQAGLALRKARASLGVEQAPSLSPGPLVEEYLSVHLPFTLTEDQRRVTDEIFDDMARSVPMNRLLQGDVGSGKTVVALLALLAALDGGRQGALLAPTEVLASQHFQRLAPVFAALGVPCALLTGSLPRREKKEIHEGLESGALRVAIGTHALFSENVVFASLGLAIVDEQHRFGVLQKQTFRSKGESPHVLVLTATPIPRTLTLTVYGDLSVSVLRQRPPGRKKITTRLISPRKLPELLSFLEGRMEKGQRVFWICPLIEESETLDLAAATVRAGELETRFSPLGTGLLHGRLPGEEKQRVMEDFQSGKISLLVSTTVVEVGVDIPGATVMVVEDPVRFGLSQLHQLRGRVGRNDLEGYCFLLGTPTSPESRERLEVFCSTENGFTIAEADLKLRGPGEVCGVRQSGITDFRVADLIKDRALLDSARKESFSLVEGDPELDGEPLLKERLIFLLGRSLNLVETA